MSASTEATPPLPALDAPHALPSACVREFRAKGHTCVRGLATREEVGAWRPLLAEAALAGRIDQRPLAERDTYGKAFLQVPNLWERDPRTRPFVFARRFARVAAELLGVGGVRLYHDQALFKEPGGGHTPWHRDQFYWPLATDDTITLWMPLVDVTAALGSIHFASGSHVIADLGEVAISDASDAHFEALIRERQLEIATHGALASGDATFHRGWTLHSAGPNPSPDMREVMTIIYFADGTRVGAADSPNRKFDLAVWLPGCQPGDLAASFRNPRLWSREGAEEPQ